MNDFKSGLSKLLIVTGLSLIAISSFLYCKRVNPDRLSFDDTNLHFQASVGEGVSPEKLIIKDLGINLYVYPSEIVSGKWQATTRGVSYLSSSPVPGLKGNSIMYGHNWPNLLGNLMKAKPGQNIEIIYSDGTKRDFKIEYTQEVSPSQSEILEQTEDTRITLYTCSGFWDSKRFVVTAIQQSNKELSSAH